MSIIKKIFGDSNEKYLQKIAPIVEKIGSFEKELAKLPNEKLKEKTLNFKERIKKEKP